MSSIIRFPNYINEVANLLGEMRRKANIDYYNKHPEKKRKNEKAIQSLGVKAELIAQHIMMAKGIAIEPVSLVANRGIAEPDIVTCSHRYDVKGVNPRSDILRVNKRVHEKHYSDRYLFIRQINQTEAVYMMYEHDDITNYWQIEDKAEFNGVLSEPFYYLNALDIDGWIPQQEEVA